MKQATAKGSNRLLSISGTFKRKARSKRQSEPHISALKTSCPEAVIATRNFSLPDEENEEEVPAFNSSGTFAAGFLSSFNASAKNALENKIEARNKLRNQSLKIPEIAESITELRRLFPDFPQQMIDCIVLRYDGNCAEAYDFMVSRDWKPISLPKEAFVNSCDIHFTTSYYHGMAPSDLELRELFKNQPIGSYITFYRPEPPGSEMLFKYYVCFKNRCGDITEKPMKFPNVAQVLVSMLLLSSPIRSTLKTSTNIVPCLSPPQQTTTN